MTKDDLDKIPFGQIFGGIKSETWETQENLYINEEVPWEKLYVKVKDLHGNRIICEVSKEIKFREKTLEDKIIEKVEDQLKFIETKLTIEEQHIFATYFIGKTFSKKDIKK